MVCGAPTYRLLHSQVQDGKLDAVLYTGLVKLLTDHYNICPSKIVQFNQYSRQLGESVASYVVALRELALLFDYRDNLLDILRNRLVCCVSHKGIQQKLLTEADLTLE